MKILYDYQHLHAQRIGGVSRVYAELIHGLQVKGHEVQLGLEYSNNVYLKQINGINIKPFYSVDEFLLGLNFKGKLRVYQQFQKLGLIKNYDALSKEFSIKKIQDQNFDVFHPTFYNPYFLNHIGKKPFVLTILDLIYEKFRNDDIAKKERESKILLSKKAAKIIAISENTKKDAIEILGIDPNKIEVIHLGNSLVKPKFENESFKDQLPQKYILYVGGRTDYKNFPNFLNAVVPILKEDKDLSLVCTGHPFSPQESIMFSLNGISEQVKFIFAEEDNFASLYSNALAFVFPSKYEGFGIPVLEAFACDCPLICSNTSSLPEVAGDAALYFNPNDVEEMRAQIKKVVSSEELRSQMISAGRERLQEFSWKKTVEKTEDLYKTII
jgi:glycosyltransferase involved in cell wall biosynthesis